MPRYRYEYLEQELKQQIRSGYLQTGDRLPSIRSLCRDYQVSKATVLHALHRLESEQLVQARPKSGYFVRTPEYESPLPTRVQTPKTPAPVSVSAIFRDIMSQGAAFDILPAASQQDSLPQLTQLNRLMGRQMRLHPEQKAGYYDESAGKYSLRTALSAHLRQRKLRVDPENICITSGCQHSLFIALMITCQPGDTVAVESPAFYGVLQIMEQLGLNIIEISGDPVSGIDIQELQEQLTHWPIKACVVTPNFGTPAGSCIPPEHYASLVDLACRNDFWLIEDDIYGDLAFSSAATAPLKSQDNPQNEKVILCGSVSKSLSRDLRVGWIIAGGLHNKALQMKLITQLASPQAIQEGLAQFIAEGHYRRHLSQLRQKLQQQRDQLLAYLSQNWGQKIRYSQPDGGLCIWVQLPDACDSQAAYRSLREEGILLTPGTLFSAHGLYRHYLRLSFAQPLSAKRKAALDRLFICVLELSDKTSCQ
ncbi:PLP-dependent aminotransferase family protein [Oceanospirillum linum]|uniref:HTH gntR-type domain-containing protein n=1 Tax=Oceanospirillum linum TaxID=966 RepID=A0A1T1HAP7_OCELI|nr:PLP-dependent aminotransferase family protein [Oceanospirillum linum]OOV86929.1 hypothetical protein BTA35_0211605 [Oceanospirillum linum]SEG18589.1 DNA-binding transcriptional regulator, MocR family, contains an aminotransferase domain [Oleiphilus messinensis]SMP24008.1 transcriptional regulator, GntR family [Oceanospirillum linum]